MKLHHIGIITHQLENSRLVYEKLGYRISAGPLNDLVQHNQLALLQNPVSGEVLELIEPLDEQSTVVHGADGYHHLCYEVASFEQFIPEFNARRAGKIFTNQISAPLFQGRMVVFAYLKNGTLIEFLERKLR